MKLCSIGLTLQNRKPYQKPNEDSFLVDDAHHIYIIADGVSRDCVNGHYPCPSPSKKVSEIFVKSSYDYVIQHTRKQSDICMIIRDAFHMANCAIKTENAIHSDVFLPGTVGIICVVSESDLYYGYIGDCQGFIYYENERIVFSNCQTELITIHGSEFSKKEIRTNICNNPAHPYSYGVLNGSPEALFFVRTGKIPLEENYGLVLCTDGAQCALNGLTNDELGNYIAKDFQQKLNSSRCDDDKTIIVVRKEKIDEDF